MENLIGLIIVFAVVLFAINRMAPNDSAVKKAAASIIAVLGAAAALLWENIQPLLNTFGGVG